MYTYDQLSARIENISTEQDLWNFFNSEAENLKAALALLEEKHSSEPEYASLCTVLNQVLVKYVLDGQESIGMKSVTARHSSSTLDLKVQMLSAPQNHERASQAVTLLINSYDALFALTENDAGTPEGLFAEVKESVYSLASFCKM